MRTVIAVGFMLLCAAIAFGAATFFGIVNANEIIHPRSTVRRLTAPRAVPASLPSEAGCSERTPLVLVWSIRNEPNRWSMDTWRVMGPRVSLWTANGVDYLAIEGGAGWPYSDTCRNLVWGTIQDWKRATTDAIGA